MSDTVTDIKELAACPLCGSQPDVRDYIATGAASYVQIECVHYEGEPGADDGTSSVAVHASNMPVAIAAWNRRAVPPAPAESGAVAWVTSDILAAMKRGESVVPGWKKSADFCIPLYTHPSPAPAASMGRVTVKALEWREEGKHWFRASSVLGAYSITEYSGMRSQGFKLEYGGGLTSYFNSLDNAKVAAQADYEQCILAALDSPPDHGGGEGWPASQKYAVVLKPFVALMEAELHANAGKGDRPGWLAMSRDEVLLEIYYHLAKLQKAVRNNDAGGIREYAADVANMSMMSVDVCGAWETPSLPTQESKDGR